MRKAIKIIFSLDAIAFGGALLLTNYDTNHPSGEPFGNHFGLAGLLLLTSFILTFVGVILLVIAISRSKTEIKY